MLRQDIAFLEEAIASAIGQTAPTEVLIVTARETPADERRLIEKMGAAAAALPDGSARVRHLAQERAGFAAALNTGFQAARSDRLGILLSDDKLSPDAVETCLPFDADIVSAGIETIAADGTVLPHVSRLVTRAAYDALTTAEMRADLLDHFFLLRRSAVARVGWVDEQLGDYAVDDFDLLWSMLEAGATVAIPGRSVYWYRDHEGERLTLRDPDASAATLARIFEKHGYTGAERDAKVDERRRWLGRTIQAVLPPSPGPSEDVLHENIPAQ